MGHNNLNAAFEELNDVTSTVPDFAEGYNRCALCYFAVEESDNSVADCHSAIKLNHFHFRVLAGMGDCYSSTGNL